MKTKKWQVALVVVAGLSLLAGLNYVSSLKSPQEQVSALIQSHRGAFIIIKSGVEEEDREFLQAWQEARPKLRGKAGVVIVDRDAGFVAPEDELPAMIIIEQHGQLIAKFHGTIDKGELAVAVNTIAMH